MRVAAAIRAALALAEADPAAGRVLTVPAANRGGDPDPTFAEMVDRLAALLRRDAPPRPDPERAARNVVLLIARQALLHLERRPEEPLTPIAPDLIVFALTPYVGLGEARRRAAA